MHKFISFYNKNKEVIFLSLLIVFLIVGGVHLLNMFVKNKNSNSSTIQETNNTYVSPQQEIKEKQENKAKQSIISNNTKQDDTFKKESTVIDTFIGYCNKKEIEQAYSLLTDECKDVLYPTIDDFKRMYIEENFSTYKTYTIQNYVNDTYMIDFTEDMLSTGMSNNGEVIRDYFTIVGDKLNISEYIGRRNINKEKIENDITIAVYYKDVFMDYEEYSIAVYNGTNNTIKLDSLENTKSIYLVNTNGIQYPAYSHELLESLIEIPMKSTRKLDIKFYNKYVSTNNISGMVFSDIIKNYEEYNNNHSSYTNRATIRIDF